MVQDVSAISHSLKDYLRSIFVIKQGGKMKKYALVMVLGGILIFSVIENVFAEETVGCPHAVGKGKFKIRGKAAYIQSHYNSGFLQMPAIGQIHHFVII